MCLFCVLLITSKEFAEPLQCQNGMVFFVFCQHKKNDILVLRAKAGAIVTQKRHYFTRDGQALDYFVVFLRSFCSWNVW